MSLLSTWSAAEHFSTDVASVSKHVCEPFCVFPRPQAGSCGSGTNKPLFPCTNGINLISRDVNKDLLIKTIKIYSILWNKQSCDFWLQTAAAFSLARTTSITSTRLNTTEIRSFRCHDDQIKGLITIWSSAEKNNYCDSCYVMSLKTHQLSSAPSSVEISDTSHTVNLHKFNSSKHPDVCCHIQTVIWH